MEPPKKPREGPFQKKEAPINSGVCLNIAMGEMHGQHGCAATDVAVFKNAWSCTFKNCDIVQLCNFA